VKSGTWDADAIKRGGRQYGPGRQSAVLQLSLPNSILAGITFEAIARVLGSYVEFRALTEAMLKDRDGGYLRCRNVLWVARCFPFGWFSKELTTV